MIVENFEKNLGVTRTSSREQSKKIIGVWPAVLASISLPLEHQQGGLGAVWRWSMVLMRALLALVRSPWSH